MDNMSALMGGVPDYTRNSSRYYTPNFGQPAYSFTPSFNRFTSPKVSMTDYGVMDFMKHEVLGVSRGKGTDFIAERGAMEEAHLINKRSAQFTSASIVGGAASMALAGGFLPALAVGAAIDYGIDTAKEEYFENFRRTKRISSEFSRMRGDDGSFGISGAESKRLSRFIKHQAAEDTHLNTSDFESVLGSLQQSGSMVGVSSAQGVEKKAQEMTGVLKSLMSVMGSSSIKDMITAMGEFSRMGVNAPSQQASMVHGVKIASEYAGISQDAMHQQVMSSMANARATGYDTRISALSTYAAAEEMGIAQQHGTLSNTMLDSKTYLDASARLSTTVRKWGETMSGGITDDAKIVYSSVMAQRNGTTAGEEYSKLLSKSIGEQSNLVFSAMNTSQKLAMSILDPAVARANAAQTKITIDPLTEARNMANMFEDAKASRGKNAAPSVIADELNRLTGYNMDQGQIEKLMDRYKAYKSGFMHGGGKEGGIAALTIGVRSAERTKKRSKLIADVHLQEESERAVEVGRSLWRQAGAFVSDLFGGEGDAGDIIDRQKELYFGDSGLGSRSGIGYGKMLSGLTRKEISRLASGERGRLDITKNEFMAAGQNERERMARTKDFIPMLEKETGIKISSREDIERAVGTFVEGGDISRTKSLVDAAASSLGSKNKVDYVPAKDMDLKDMMAADFNEALKSKDFLDSFAADRGVNSRDTSAVRAEVEKYYKKRYKSQGRLAARKAGSAAVETITENKTDDATFYSLDDIYMMSLDEYNKVRGTQEYKQSLSKLMENMDSLDESDQKRLRAINDGTLKRKDDGARLSRATYINRHEGARTTKDRLSGDYLRERTDESESIRFNMNTSESHLGDRGQKIEEDIRKRVAKLNSTKKGEDRLDAGDIIKSALSGDKTAIDVSVSGDKKLIELSNKLASSQDKVMSIDDAVARFNKRKKDGLVDKDAVVKAASVHDSKLLYKAAKGDKNIIAAANAAAIDAKYNKEYSDEEVRKKRMAENIELTKKAEAHGGPQNEIEARAVVATGGRGDKKQVIKAMDLLAKINKKNKEGALSGDRDIDEFAKSIVADGVNAGVDRDQQTEDIKKIALKKNEKGEIVKADAKEKEAALKEIHDRVMMDTGSLEKADRYVAGLSLSTKGKDKDKITSLMGSIDYVNSQIGKEAMAIEKEGLSGAMDYLGIRKENREKAEKILRDDKLSSAEKNTALKKLHGGALNTTPEDAISRSYGEAQRSHALDKIYSSSGKPGDELTNKDIKRGLDGASATDAIKALGAIFNTGADKVVKAIVHGHVT